MKTLKEIDIGYPIITGLIGFVYGYLEFSIEVYDVATVLAMFWMYWKIASRHPNLSDQFRILIAILTICGGLIAYYMADFIGTIMFPDV